MKKNFTAKFFIIALPFIFIFVNGCTANQKETNPATIQTEILNKMALQKDYAFQGKTSIKLTEETIEDVVTFDGYINNKENMFLNLNIESLDDIPKENMQFIQRPQKMIVKYAEENNWREVSENEQKLFAELNRWNPEYVMQTIYKSKGDAQIIEEKNGYNGLMVRINENDIKAQIEEQLRATLNDGGLTEEDIDELKNKLGYTEEEIANMQKELQVQVGETKEQIDEMLRTMKIEAYYNVYYSPNDFLIQEIQQNINTSYQLEGESVVENMKININFFDYGKRKNLPIT